MSIGFLLDSEKEPVVLRGPRKDGVVRQFLGGVSWGELDVLLVDTPPGTSDEHMSLVGALSKTLGPHDGAVVVSTPQAVSARRRAQGARLLREAVAPRARRRRKHGALRTPLHQLQFFDGAGDDVTEATLAALPASLRGVHAAVDVFPSAEGGAEAMAADFGVPFLGRVPLDGAITAASEAGAACASSIALDGVAATLLDALHLDDDAAVGAPPPPPPPPRPSGGGSGRRALHTLRRPLSTAVRRRREEHAAAAASPAAAVELRPEQKLFPTTVHEYRFAVAAGAAARGVQRRSRRARRRWVRAVLARARGGGARADGAGGRLADDGEHALLPPAAGGYWREAGGAEHLGALQRAPEFRSLVASMRAAAAYLGAHGVDDAAAAVEASPLFCWASVHLGGSTHPPHVHSDASVTGTYYARRPAGAAPLSLEDPRGRSPFDLVAGLEHRLRYGDGDGSRVAPSLLRPRRLGRGGAVGMRRFPAVDRALGAARARRERRRGGVGARRRAAARLLLVQPAGEVGAHGGDAIIHIWQVPLPRDAQLEAAATVRAIDELRRNSSPTAVRPPVARARRMIRRSAVPSRLTKLRALGPCASRLSTTYTPKTPLVRLARGDGW